MSLLAVLSTGSSAAEIETRGVGVYPGDPREDFAPVLVPDTSTYRNLALRRPALQSSAYDYNLTAQLVTDGVRETTPPRWLETTTSTGGVVSKVQRELLVDHSSTSALDIDGKQAWVQLALAGGDSPLAIDRVELEMRPRRPAPWRPPGEAASPEATTGGSAWTVTVSGSDDGQAWAELGRTSGALPEAPPPPTGGDWAARFEWFRNASPTVRPSIPLGQAVRHRHYRVSLEFAGGPPWALAEVAFFEGSRRVEVGGPYRFASAWMPEGKGEEWVSVDLGARCTFDRVALHWIRRAAEGAVQASDDGEAWRDVWTLRPGAGLADDVRLPRAEQGRYVRVLLRRPVSPEGYALSELEVFGRGGPVARPKPAPKATADGRLHLAGGAWRLQRDSLVKADGASLSRPGFRDAEWVVATVPATVLSSYWNAGALPDPNFGDNQLAISDSFFYADFWYRTEFEAPRLRPGRRAFLAFDGVNWKAEVFLNGERLGRVEGAFTRGRFDVTRHLRPGKKNALAVRVEKNATPGSMKQKTLESAGLNGGALGADNPTYHASIGWDWIPTVRGRVTGLWNDVHLDVTGPVTIEDPFVRTTLPLPDTSRADVRVEVSLANHESKPVSGTLRGRFGDVAFEQAVALDAASTKTVVLDPSTHPALRLDRAEAVVAERVRRAEPLRRDARVRGGRAGLGHEVVPRRRPAVHLQRGGRRPPHLGERPALRRARGELGLPRDEPPLPRPRVRRRRALPPRHELHDDPQLGGPDRRRRVLRGLRPARHRRLAGLLAREPLRRARPRRRRALPRATRATSCGGSATTHRWGSTAGGTRASRPRRSTPGIRQALSELARRHPLRPELGLGRRERGRALRRPDARSSTSSSGRPRSSTASWACPPSSTTTASAR